MRCHSCFPPSGYHPPPRSLEPSSGEWIGSDKGLGAMIIQATFNYQSGRLYAAITLCSCLAILLFLIVVAVEKAVLRYER